MTKLCLSLYFCHNKTFVTTNICCDIHVFVVTKVLLQHAYFCCDKRPVLSQQSRVCRNKSKLVMTNIIFVATKVLLQQFVVVVATNVLSQQAYFCHDKRHVVATKIILMAAPTNDIFQYPLHPRVTTVAFKRSHSLCQKLRWQVTSKHTSMTHVALHG